jgi:N6-adenosine-specific RNA methylase IME4
MRFPVILADPPVPFECWSKPTKAGSGNRTAADHYSLMTWDDLSGLGPLIRDVAAPDCCLFLWLCQPLLLETLRLAEAWGFTYKTKAFSWVKTYSNGSSFFVGMGYWTRANTEDVLLFTRGDPRRADKGVYQVLATLEASPYETPAVVAPMTRHSEKPEAVQDRIERLVDGPWLELFARRQRPGWATVGNEVDGLDIRQSLARLAADEPLPTMRADVEQHSLLETV